MALSPTKFWYVELKHVPNSRSFKALEENHFLFILKLIETIALEFMISIYIYDDISYQLHYHIYHVLD